MISPARLAHLLLEADSGEPAVGWVEGGGAPIEPAPPGDMHRIGEWALSHGAVGVLVRQRGEERAYWWGPGTAIPFNKADVLPIAALHSHGPGRRPQWQAHRADAVDATGGPYLGYWADRAWSSLHSDQGERRRRLFAGELRPILVAMGIDAVVEAEEVEVTRHDMFREGAPHLRGMIRNRQVDGLESCFSDAEDAVHPYFHLGPPRRMQLEPPP